MDNFLTILYKEYFFATKELEGYMSNHFEVGVGEDDSKCVRNDQSISECRKKVKMLAGLIEEYMLARRI